MSRLITDFAGLSLAVIALLWASSVCAQDAGQALSLSGTGFMEAPALEQRSVEVWINLGQAESMGIFSGGGFNNYEFHVFRPNQFSGAPDSFGIYHVFTFNEPVVLVHIGSKPQYIVVEDDGLYKNSLAELQS